MILGLTTLMAMAVELEIIAEEMPKTEKMPLLGNPKIKPVPLLNIVDILEPKESGKFLPYIDL